ncbi:MAG: DUF5672 family protein [bacterium]
MNTHNTQSFVAKCDVCVILIVYRTTLDRFEKLSLNQCLATLGKHTIKTIAPTGLPLPKPLQAFPCERFAPEFFTDVAGYNRLMLSPEFYARFLDFRHILIHQLDAFVFKDELNIWCEHNFDYIGAPWLGVKFPTKESTYAGLPEWSWRRRFPDQPRHYVVGNGGFSLRRVETMHRILTEFAEIRHLWGTRHEDAFWGIAVPECIGDQFRLPSFDDAVAFAFETQPSECYERNNLQLPFGCHAWHKLDPAFWQPHFKSLGRNFTLPGYAWQDRLEQIYSRFPLLRSKR